MKKIKKKHLKNLDKLPCLEIRYKLTKLKKKPLDKTKKYVKYLRKLYDKNTFWEREEMVVLALENDLYPIGYFSISKGDFKEVGCCLSHIFRRLHAAGATAFITSHNHPNNLPYPSDADVKGTNALRMSAKQVNLEMVDNVIITDKDYFSFDDEGMLFE